MPEPSVIAQWIPLINTAGVIVGLVILVGAIVRGWLVPKHYVDKERETQHKAAIDAAKEVGETVANRVGLEIERGMTRVVEKLGNRPG